ncbi:bifunctional arginine demethylase and lysyl-hydroxylase PSR-like isoform X2 [Petromyzon marinus]
MGTTDENNSQDARSVEALTAKFLELYQSAVDGGLTPREARAALMRCLSKPRRRPCKKHACKEHQRDASGHRAGRWTWATRLYCALTPARLCAVAALAASIVLAVAKGDSLFSEPCLMDMGLVATEISRPPSHCPSLCADMEQVPVLACDQLSPQEFLRTFAYTGRPLLVRGATSGWKALADFNFTFFQLMYSDHSEALRKTVQECQFFSYSSGFTSLADVFNMTEERATLQDGGPSWYVGWSSCSDELTPILRSYYQRPAFLPANSESSTLDWVFMGWAGQGSHIHLDKVQRPSWQAQISGMKTWDLLPPPECEDVCHPLQATLQKGDILIVDTNQWYHSTYIHHGELCISIGSEYD